LTMTSCCTTPKAPQACLVGGTVEPVLDGYGVTYDKHQPPSLDELKMWLWFAHPPVISHHKHPEGAGHFVDLVATYRLHGQNMVVVWGTQFDGYWVDTYSDYMAKHDSWWVADVYTNFAKH